MARILVVDDSEMMLSLVDDVLQKYAKELYQSEWSLKITPVTSAVAALELFKNNHYELVITDIMMSKMDGWEFIRELRKEHSRSALPIVVVSAIDGVDLKYAAIRNGASSWFTKPLHPREFAKSVFRLLSER